MNPFPEDPDYCGDICHGQEVRPPSGMRFRHWCAMWWVAGPDNDDLGLPVLMTAEVGKTSGSQWCPIEEAHDELLQAWKDLPGIYAPLSFVSEPALDYFLSPL